jgi:outer membrane protein assembly factor BamB
LTWDVATGRGVLWRTNVPLAGYNSPVVWGDRVFLTGGDKKSRLVFCFDAATGSLRWQRPVTPTNALAAPIDPPDQSGAAASTVATDGRRVFAVFASGELGALDFEGTLVWHTRLDFSENGYGHAASLVVSGGRVLVQADQGQPEDGKSQLLALDAATGKVVWTAKRPVGGSWTTPLVVGAGEAARVLTAGDPWLMAHELASGAEVWRARLLGGELAPSPVLAGGMVLAVWPGHAFYAVKADGTGDVTVSHVAWKLEEEIPDVPTPVVAGDLLFTANTEGHLICRELATGGKVWDHAFETEFQATPLVVGDRMYLFSQPGKVFVVAVGREFKELASFEMGEEIYASPAVAGGRMYVRTKTALFGLGDGAGPTQVAQNAR